jgi:hemoglobin-like flavoprotein
MNFIKRNYSQISVVSSLSVGIIAYLISYHLSKGHMIDQTAHTIQMVTQVKLQLIDNKLFSLEQQLHLLSKNDKVQSLLTPEDEKASKLNSRAQFDDYIKGILYTKGYSSVLLIRPSGKLVYASNVKFDKTTIPQAVYKFAQQSTDSLNPTSNLKIILDEHSPFPFYLCKRIVDDQGIFRGTLGMEVPREFLSVELHNTLSFDSLNSYLVTAQGTMDQLGRVTPDTCIFCKWDKDAFISFSPREKIEGTWTLLSVYPISEISIQHITYTSVLDGLIAFFVATGIILTIIYCIQLVQKAKGITHADILLVQTTWNAVSEYSIQIITSFYKYLFADAPEVRPMFKSDKAEQQKRMALMINTIVNSADSLEEFKASISQLAKRHTHMGVKREYFPIVVKAIICSVEDQYGKGFTPAHKKAWYKILNQVSAIMIEEMESYQQILRNTAA